VDVDGGRLAAGEWAGDGPTVVAVHGISSNHLSFAVLADALPDARLVAPDLRGRARSAGLPGPWGMDRHAADVAALVDAVGGPVLLLGHSTGAFVAAAVVRRYPGLVRGLVLVDGGLPFRLPEGVTVEQATAQTLGPALDRLRMTFPSRSAYLDFWRPHPALKDDWSEAIEDYLTYDLVGEPPELRSSVSAEAVIQDAADQQASPENVLGTYAGPARMLVVPRDLLDRPPGLYPDGDLEPWRSRLPGLVIERVPDLNHYTILLRPAGAARVAETLRAVG
jgi:lipase